MKNTDHLSFVLQASADLQDELTLLFHAQWADPELSGMEYRSADRLCRFLEGHGFQVTRSAHGIPTAFDARFGQSGGPVIALLAEYDALPGLGNQAVPTRVATGQTAGHACGHNHIGPANVAAAVMAARHLAATGRAGQVRVIGCPAEEILWGKIALLKAGAFQGVDAILTSHGDYQNGALSRPCQSVVSGEFVFLGEAGHGGFAGASNALLAAEAFVAEVADSVGPKHPDVTFRHVVRQGGAMPGITPDEARIWYTARNVDIARARAAYEAIAAAASAVAKNSSVQLRHQFISETRGYLPNDAMGKLLRDCLDAVGPPQWSAADIDFMADIVKQLAPDEEMRLQTTLDYFDRGEDYYGQDDGEVSWRIPLGRLNWAYPEQVPIHHWAWTAVSGHRASHAGPIMASKALALAAMRLFDQRGIINDAKSELRDRTAGLRLDEVRLGAIDTLTRQPELFWNASWVEAATR